MEPQVNLSVAIEKLHNTVKQNMLLVEFTSVKVIAVNSNAMFRMKSIEMYNFM